MKDPITGQPVSLQEMMDARERRAARQRALLAAWKKPLICFTLNIPGEYKVFLLSVKSFLEGRNAISLLLEKAGVEIMHYEEYSKKTGMEAFFAVNGNAGEIKKLLLPLEESHFLGRLFDIDVLDADGTPLNRIDYGQSERKCLICENPVWECSRSRIHSSKDLLSRVADIMQNYFNGLSAN